jgi:hypothetical protein
VVSSGDLRFTIYDLPIHIAINEIEGHSLARNVLLRNAMAIISLPQTKGEIQAAAAEIVYVARHDLWSGESDGKHYGTSRVIKADQVATDCIIEDWLRRSAKLGAMESKALLMNVELMLLPWSDDAKKLGAKRVVTVLSRRRWRGATSAAAFLASH